MDNPAYFTVLNDDGTQPRVSGLLASRASAVAEAQARRDEGEIGQFSIAVATTLDQDPVSGTPIDHAPPRDPAGYTLGSLSAADPSRRSLEGILFEKEWLARTIAGAARAKNRASENDTVLDIVAITVIDQEV